MKIKGLKRIAGDSKFLNGYYSGRYIQVNYDRETGYAWGDFFHSLGQNSWNVYHSPDVIRVGNICEPTSMEELRRLVADAVDLHDRKVARESVAASIGAYGGVF